MIEYIKGLLVELTPANAVIENNGIGYYINISVNTYSVLKEGQECILFTHQVIREDAHLLYGFLNQKEREIFRLLISVNGVGANTARIILSSITTSELINAISKENVNVLKGAKGIGIKTAQRIIIELKDKIIGFETENSINFDTKNNTLKKDALNALVVLGFNKSTIEKVLNKIIDEQNETSLEKIIKLALNYL
ncbi:MAG: Holliday junction branch migration protein RuvA [Bacteroidales bacterium]|jgi:Holliday junction DNA helicase RuvA|nr:Holliday junction branch migration protein RuvA [Bacteroidales bacterium]